MGISWMDAVLHTTSMHRSLEAVPGLRRASRRAASRPRGVAALPSPSRLADTLAEMLSMVSRSLAAWGKSRRSTGASSRDSPSASPDRRMTSITPVHRQSIPAMDRASCTAAEAPSTAAEATAGPRPVASPHRMERTTIPVQITVIVMPIPPLVPSIRGQLENHVCWKTRNLQKNPAHNLFSTKILHFSPHFAR